MAIKTHYDNLKVARNAPDAVIRAAYRSLIEKYHPSRRPNSSEAARISKILDEAYETLTDPVLRKNHDQWIARKEHREAMERAASTTPAPTPEPRAPIKNMTSSFMRWARVDGHGQRLIVGLLLVSATGVFAWRGQRGPSASNDVPRTTQSYDAAPPPAPTVAPTPAVPVQPVYQRPVLADNGYPWPTVAGYMQDYPKLNTHGLSEVHVDNSQNDSDVMVKLVSAGGTTAFPIRVFYIPTHGEFTVKNVAPGTYDVRFRMLANGSLSRSETFNLEQTPDANGRGERYSHYDLTLYTVMNGNTHLYPLNPKDF
jgi:hypothetical protein